MKRLTAALLAIALVAIVHFWPGEQRSTPSSELKGVAARDPFPAPAGGRASAEPPATVPAPMREPTAQSGTSERPAIAPLKVAINAPHSIRAGETFPVEVELQAMQEIRQLVFSVVYKKSILELARSSPGAFVGQGGTSVQFEEVSEGSLLVRVGLEGGVLAGAGTVAVVEFRARTRGVSPLAIQDVAYASDSAQRESNIPVAYEGSITVE